MLLILLVVFAECLQGDGALDLLGTEGHIRELRQLGQPEALGIGVVQSSVRRLAHLLLVLAAGCRRQALVSWVLFEGALVGSVK